MESLECIRVALAHRVAHVFTSRAGQGCALHADGWD